MDEKGFEVALRLEGGYRFSVDFEGGAASELMVDEPPPLGEGSGPNAARLLGAAIGNCLAASLLFCLKRARVEVADLEASVKGTMARNEKGRLRIRDVAVELRPGGIAEEDLPRLRRCMEVYEDFCIVTQSVRDGLDVRVSVEPAGQIPYSESAPAVQAVP
jgi:uncharacterized OsmC-like protein